MSPVDPSACPAPRSLREEVAALSVELRAELKRITQIRVRDNEAQLIPGLTVFMWLERLDALLASLPGDAPVLKVFDKKRETEDGSGVFVADGWNITFLGRGIRFDVDIDHDGDIVWVWAVDGGPVEVGQRAIPVALPGDAAQDANEAILAALKNMGHDTACGACMEIAFTGVTTNEHSCAQDAPPAPQGWQPIDSAPKDGTRVLLWGPTWVTPRCGQFFGPDWRHFYERPFTAQPTVWVPLPAPPVSEDTPRHRYDEPRNLRGRNGGIP
jgi:hypothetical protein